MNRLYPLHAFYAVLLAGSLLLMGCGGPPGNNPLLEEARVAFAEAESDPQVVAKAPVALQEAEEDLRRSEQLWRDKADEEKIEHYAYLAKQRVAIAQETARLKTAEETIEKAELERKEVMLEAREQEAQRAERQAALSKYEAEAARTQAEAKAKQAREAQREAEIARLQAAEALARARALADRVQELEARETERGLVLTLSDVLFDVDKATLKPGGLRAVDELSRFLKEYPERNVLVEGFTDSTGPEAYNLDLSRSRAAAVRTALMERGIEAARIRTVGYGEAYPVASNGTAAGRQQNRRVEVVISDQTGEIPARQ